MLFYVQMKWNYQGRISQDDLWTIEAKEGDHAQSQQGQTKDPVKVEMQLKKVIEPDKQNDTCHRLVEHGRAVCTARKPYCEKCVLSGVCDYKKELDKQARTVKA